MSLARARATAPVAGRRRQPASAGCTPRGVPRPEPAQRPAAHSDARRLPFLGQDRGAPAHLVGGAHRRRAAGVPRHRRRAVPRLPHRLLPGAAAAGLIALRRPLLLGPAARRPRLLRARCLADRLRAVGHRHPPRAPLPALAHPLARHPRRPVGALGAVRLDLSVDHAADPAHARLDPARGAPCGCRRRCSTTRASATRPSPSPAAPGRSTGASGWCGSAPSSLLIGASAAIAAIIGIDTQRRRSPRMRPPSPREDRGHRRASSSSRC